MLCGIPQEFFYHVLLVLDSHTFNSHMKVELAAEIARLYQQQTAFKTRRKGLGFVKDGDEQGSRGSASAGEGVRGFTGTMVKLKVIQTEFFKSALRNTRVSFSPCSALMYQFQAYPTAD